MTVGMLAFAVLVGGCAFAYDFAVAQYNRALRAADSDGTVGRSAAYRAAAWSVTIYLVGLVGILGVVQVSTWLIVPEAIGFYLGTLAGARAAVYWKRKEGAVRW